MRRCLLLISLCLVSLFAHPLWAADFLLGTEDVPLMSGLELSEDETFDFDGEEGRLYFSKAYTKIDSQHVMRFYNETLPQLGWVKNEDGHFIREGDILRIAVVSGDFQAQNLTSVLFELVIKSK